MKPIILPISHEITALSGLNASTVGVGIRHVHTALIFFRECVLKLGVGRARLVSVLIHWLPDSSQNTASRLEGENCGRGEHVEFCRSSVLL